VMNNLSSGTITMNPEVIVRGNLAKQDLTGVFDPKVRSHGQANPGRGRGVPIRRVTPGTNVDVGAYQRGRPAWRAGHDFQNPPDVSYVPADEPLRNHIRNAAFEYQRYDPDLDPLVHWTRIGAANVKVEFHKGFNSPPANARNSVHGNSVVFAGKEDCGIKQTVTTLLPNTTYVLSGYAKHADEVNVEFAVSPVAGKPLKKASSSDTALKQNQTWRFVCVPFKTGPRQTSASVTILKRDPGKAYVDDTGVVPRIYDELEK